MGRHDDRGTTQSGREDRPLERIRREMDRVFDRVLDDWGVRVPGMRWPAIEMFDRGDQMVVRVELPGMKREDVRVRVAGDMLRIEGERRDQREQEHMGVRRSEWNYGRFMREVPIPSDVDPTKLSAHMSDGILELAMTYREERREREIPIQEGRRPSETRP